MSTEIAIMRHTGSRDIDFTVTRYWGGKKGSCIQVTGIMEEGNYGYVQFNRRDILRLVDIWQKHIGELLPMRAK